MAWRVSGPYAGKQGGEFAVVASRLGDGSVLAVGAPRVVSHPVLCQRLEVASGTWSEAAPPPTVSQGHSMCALADGRVLLLTGHHTGDCTAFDPVRGEWQAVPPLLQPRRHAALVRQGERVLAIGGGSYVDTFAHVEAWSPGEPAWQRMEPLRVPRRAPTALALADGSLVVLDASGAERCVDGVWTALPGLALAPGAAVVAWGEGLALLGGLEGRESQDWKVVGNQIVGGGTVRDCASRRVFCWSPASGARELEPLPVARAAAAALPLPDGRLALVGGYATLHERVHEPSGDEYTSDYYDRTTRQYARTTLVGSPEAGWTEWPAPNLDWVQALPDAPGVVSRGVTPAPAALWSP